MKILLDIDDNKAASFLEMLENYSYVNATTISKPNSEFLSEFKDAVDEVKLAKQGKVQLQSLQSFLDELKD